MRPRKNIVFETWNPDYRFRFENRAPDWWSCAIGCISDYLDKKPSWMLYEFSHQIFWAMRCSTSFWLDFHGTRQKRMVDRKVYTGDSIGRSYRLHWNLNRYHQKEEDSRPIYLDFDRSIDAHKFVKFSGQLVHWDGIGKPIKECKKISIFKCLSLIHIWRCRRSTLCRSRWSPYH